MGIGTQSKLNTSRRVGAATVAVLCMGVTLALPARAASPSPTPKGTFPPAPPSAIGSEMVQWLAVSPAYKETGLVVAQATQLNCPQGSQCIHLWVTHDGGSSWHKAAAKGWNGGRVAIAVDGKGHETLYAGVSAQLAKSEDGGETWSQGAPRGGVPTVLPTYAQDGGIAVASTSNASDYLLRGGAQQDVAGSGGADTDVLYMASPSFPNAGSFSPALLTALDKKTSALLVLHCTAQFSCSSPTVIPGPASGSAMTSAGTVLLPSDGYADDGTVFADTPLGVAKSTDGAVTFAPLSVVSTQGATATSTPMMALAPGYREHGGTRTAYVAVFQLFRTSTSGHTSGGIYATSDGGASWQALATTGPFAGGAQAVATAPDGRVFAGYYDGYGHGGLLCSTSQGRAWDVSCPAVGNHAKSGSSSGGSKATCIAAATSCTAGGSNGGAGANAAGANGTSDNGSANGGDTAAGTAGAKLTSDSKPGTAVIVALVLAGVLLALAVVRTVVVRRTRRASPEA